MSVHTARLLTGAAALTVVLAAAPAHAADPTDLDAAAAPETPQRDIVVTAQKRSESVQKVPATITAIGGDTLEHMAIDSAVDVARFAPNANAWNNDGRSRPRYFIRGIGNGNVSNNAVGAVSLYNDEVYLNSLVLQGFPIVDLERVEVLSGPQGTLQGKNATAGAINFISRRPSFDTDRYARVSIGDYGQKQFESAFGGALTSGIAARAAVRIEKQDGFADNRATGNESGDFRDIAARFQLLGKLGDAGEVIANVHYRSLDATRTATYGSIQPQTAPLAIGSRRFTNSNIDNVQKVDASGGFLRFNLAPGAGLSLTSITAYDEGDRVEFSDTDNTARELGRAYSRTRPEQFSQELRLASPGADRLNWILGAYYFHEKLRAFNAQATINNASGGTPAYFYTSYTQKTDSFALFGNARLDVTDRLHLQGGLRWTRDESSIVLVSQRAVAPVTFVTPDRFWQVTSTGQTLVDIARQDQSADWSKLTYDAAVHYDIAPGVKLYARIGNGYRAGNFQGQVTATTPPGVVDPETLTAYEGGIKSQWLDGAVTFNLSAFYSDYKDIQVSVVRPTASGTNAQLANAGGGYSKGIEAELRLRPTARFNVYGNLGLLDTKFTSFTITNATANIDGAEFARAPHRTAFIAADYTVPTRVGSFTLDTSWRYNSHFFYLITDERNPALQQDGYAVGDVRISYHAPGDRIDLTAGLYNVADKRYTVQVLPYTFGSYGYALGAPRTFLSSVKVRL